MDFLRGQGIWLDKKDKVYKVILDSGLLEVRFGLDRGMNVPDPFLTNGVRFEVLKRGPGFIHLGQPETQSGRVMWALNRVQNAWMKDCPVKDYAKISYVCTEGRCDEMCVRGFYYEDEFGEWNRTRIGGKDLVYVCDSIGQACRKEYFDASDLMYAEYDGHFSTGDTAIEHFGVRYEDYNLYKVLIDLGVVIAVRSGGVNYFKLKHVHEEETSLIGWLCELKHRFELHSFGKQRQDTDPVEILCEEQVKAVQTCMSNPVSYLTGCAGRGKSSAVVDIVRRSSGTLVLTPTHAARKVSAERIGSARLPETYSVEVVAFAKYILLSTTKEAGERKVAMLGKFEHVRLETLVLEEASMIDLSAASSVVAIVLEAFPSIVRVVFVGDSMQLRSVGKGNLLEDIVTSGVVPGSRLTINHRSGSALSRNVDKIVAGDFRSVVVDEKSFRVCTALDPARVWNEKKQLLIAGDAAAAAYIRAHQAGRRVHAICYMNKEVRAVNKSVKEGLFGACDEQFPKGCKVRVTNPAVLTPRLKVHKNDLLTVRDSYVTEDGVDVVVAEAWSGGGDVLDLHVDGRLSDAFDLGYATTCHSFQGAEADVVIVHAIMNSWYFDRLALYTAVSRAREVVDLVTCAQTEGKHWSAIVSKQNRKRVSSFRGMLQASKANFCV